MNNHDEQRFNLVFSGQLLPGTDRNAAQRTLATFFGMPDPAAVAGFFSGKALPLRRNLPKQDAIRLYRQFRSDGLICDVEAIDVLPEPPADSEPEASEDAPQGSIAVQAPREASAKPGATPVAPRETATEQVAHAVAQRSESSEVALRAAELPQAYRRRRESHVPNFFALRPAQATATAATLRAGAVLRASIAGGLALTLLLITSAVLLRFPPPPPGAEPRGPLAGTTLPGGGLILMLPGALLEHARSGLPRRVITAEELGLKELQPPLWADGDGRLFLNGVSTIDVHPTPQLYRCSLDTADCAPFLPVPTAAPAVALGTSTLGDVLYLLDDGGGLHRLSPEGVLQGTAAVALPWGWPRLLAADGLLLLPAADGPLLGVFSPDRRNFGQQLDALLLMPSAAVDRGQDRIQDVAAVAQGYWALLAGEDARGSLYRFDGQWNATDLLQLPENLKPTFLLPWRDKLLVGDPESLVMPRYAGDGRAEAPLESQMLADYRSAWLQTAQLRALLRTAGISMPLLFATLSALVAGLLFLWVRHLPDRLGERSRLLDPMPAGVHWLPAARHQSSELWRISAILFAAAALPMLVLWAAVSTTAALSLVPAILATSYVSFALKRGAGGYIGLLRDHLIAIDYDGRYFYGDRSQRMGNRQILVTPGVAVPLGFAWLSNLDVQAIEEHAPVLPEGKGDIGEVLAMLWTFRHPWLLAALALAAGWLLSIGLLITLAG